jgi:transposase InsO family protein
LLWLSGCLIERLNTVPSAYPAEFRARAVALVRAGKQQKRTATELGILPVTLSKWVKQARVDRGEIPGSCTVESAELRTAHRRIRELETELVIVRQAAKEGCIYCAAVLDAFSRRIGGWSIDSKQDATLVVNALDMAIRNRRPAPGGVVHADHGTQFTSWVFGEKISSAGLLPSFGTVGDGLDNSMMESSQLASRTGTKTVGQVNSVSRRVGGVARLRLAKSPVKSPSRTRQGLRLVTRLSDGAPIGCTDFPRPRSSGRSAGSPGLGRAVGPD